MTDINTQLQRLNSQQRQAVEAIDGPVMVVAGPGTGKTQILALRIANILAKTDTLADNILCLTFTEAGVRAMRERLISIIGHDAYHVSINTFHGFANEIIQTFADKFAFSKELLQIDDLTKIKLIREIIDANAFDENSKKESKINKLAPFHDKYAKVSQIISDIQTLKKEGITPDDLRIKVKNLEEELRDREKPTKKWQGEMDKLLVVNELALVYENYQAALQEKGMYDYEDMILLVIEKFESDDELLAYYQEKYLYIHVDEYQDTNGAQNKIIELLGKFDSSPNIFAVGDDDQAIYRFQGANLENILFFSKHFTNVQTIPITQNYRSTQIILDIADSLIKNNSLRLVNEYKDLNKDLTSSLKDANQQKAEVWEFTNSTEENIFIAKQIKDLNAKGVKNSEIAVIFRRNAHAEDINETLHKFEIPTKLDVSKSVFESKAVIELIDLLRVISLFRKDIDEALYRILMLDYLYFKPVDVYRLCKHVYKNKLSLFELLIDEQELAKVEVVNAAPFIEFGKKLINWHKTSETKPLFKLVEDLFLEIPAILEYYSHSESADKNFSDLLSLNSFYEYIKDQSKSADNKLTLAKFLQDLELIKENKIKVSIPKTDNQSDAVNLLTAHGSKGLEFEYVFITKATHNNWGSPGRNTSILPKEIYSEAIEGKSEKELSEEDERRLFFVAITRAKKKVCFTYASEYIAFGNTQATSPSMFLNEIASSKVTMHKNSDVGIAINSDDLINVLKSEIQTDYTKEEREYLLEQVTNFKLSASSLNAYLNSPLEFKNNILLKIPKATDKHLALGNAIHFALDKFNKSFTQKSVPSVTSMLLNFKKKLTDEFQYDDEFARTLKEGEEIIKSYYAEYVKNGKYVAAIESEYNFFAHNVFLEVGDAIEPIPLSGRIDKIEMIDEAINEVRVIDYKTGASKTRNEILGETQSSKGEIWRQLVFYQLLALQDKLFRPERSTSKPKYTIKEVEVDFVKPNKGKFRKERFQITHDDISQLKELIVEVMKRVRNLEFPESCDLV